MQTTKQTHNISFNKMLRYITLLFVVPFLANCYWEDTLHDGPCPKQPKGDADSIAGEYWMTETNREIQNENPITCAAAVLVKAENGAYNVVTSYITSNGPFSIKQKVVPIEDAPVGNWAAQELDEKTGEYKPNGWLFTAADVVDGGLLELACKEEGNKHKRFYQLFISKTKPPSEKDLAALLKTYKDSGDGRPMIDVKNDNCDKTKE